MGYGCCWCGACECDKPERVRYGDGTTEYGPGVAVEMTGDELASAVVHWLHSQGVNIYGPRSITVNGEWCRGAEVYVDPSGYVMYRGQRISGRGPGAKGGGK